MRALSLAIVLALCGLPVGAQDQERPRFRRLRPGSAQDWLLDPASGRVYAALPDGVAELDAGSGEVLRTLPVPGGARRLLLRGELLVAAVRDLPRVAVLERKQGTLLGTVDLPADGPVELCGGPLLQRAFAISAYKSEHGRLDDGVIFGVDLGALKVVSTQRFDDEIRTASFSRDGRLLLADRRGSGIMPTGLSLFHADEARGVFRRTRSLHEERYEHAPAPGGGWISGRQVASPDLSSWSPKFAGAPLALHPTCDLAASLRFSSPYHRAGNVTLVFQRASDQRVLKTFRVGRFPWAKDQDQAYAAQRGFPTLRFDAERQRLLIGWSAYGLVGYLERLGLPLKPRLRLEGPALLSAEVGRPLAAPLRLNLPGEPRLRLLEAPEGLRLEGSELRWTPSAEQLGEHTCRVEARLAGHGRAYLQIPCEVRRPAPSFPAAARLVPSPDGARAVLFRRARSGDTSLELVELPSGAPLRTLPAQPAAHLALGEGALWLVQQDRHRQQKPVLRRLELSEPGAKPAQPREVALPCEEASGVVALPGDRVAVLSDRQTWIYDCELKLLRTLGPPLRHHGGGHGLVPVDTGAGYLVGEQVLDERGEVALVWGPLHGLPNASEVRGHHRGGYGNDHLDETLANFVHAAARGLHPWGGVRGAGAPGIHFGQVQRQVCTARPLDVALWYEDETITHAPQTIAKRAVWLEWQPLAGGSPTRLLVGRTELRSRGSARAPLLPLLVLSGERAYVSWCNRLHAFPAPAAPATPLTLAPRLTPRTLAHDGAVVRWEVATPPGATLSLAYPLDGLRLEGGRLELDPRALWESYRTDLATRVVRSKALGRTPYGLEHTPWTRAEHAAGFAPRARDLFACEDQERFPLVVPLVLEAQRGEERAVLWGNALILAPWSEVEAALRGEGGQSAPSRANRSSPSRSDSRDRPIRWRSVLRGGVALIGALMAFFAWLAKRLSGLGEEAPRKRLRKRQPIKAPRRPDQPDQPDEEHSEEEFEESGDEEHSEEEFEESGDEEHSEEEFEESGDEEHSEEEFEESADEDEEHSEDGLKEPKER